MILYLNKELRIYKFFRSKLSYKRTMFLTITHIFKKNIISIIIIKIIYYSQGLRLELSEKTKQKL